VPFAAAVSMHPVPAYATGEVIGQLAEKLGVGPDLLVVAARPGHAGALEDIAATIRRLLAPGVLIGGISEGVGSATQFADGGPALGLWGASGGVVEPWAPVGTGRRGLRAEGSAPSRAGERPDGAGAGTTGIVLTAGGPWPISSWGRDDPGLTAGGPWPISSWGRDDPGLAVVGGVVRGPVILNDEIVAVGSVGARVGGGLAPRIRAVSDLAPIGPRLVVTAVVGPSLIELDGQPALDRLTAVVRDHVPADQLSRIGDELFIGAIGPDPAMTVPPARVLGADRRHGAVVIAPGHPVQIGDTVMVLVAAADNVERSLRAGLDAVGDADGVILFAAPGHGRPAGAGMDVFTDEEGFESGWGLLPDATLSIETAPPYCGPLTGPAEVERSSALALFS
jgi:small ligand-binding sensory domain FIST